MSVSIEMIAKSPEAATRVEFALFAAATLAGHLGSAKFYRALIRRDRKHAVLRVAWTALYVFVAIQLAWVCRPFIGDPRLATSFLREDAWSNAYVTVARQLLGG